MQVFTIQVDAGTLVHFAKVVEDQVALLARVEFLEQVVYRRKVAFHLLVELRDPLCQQHPFERLLVFKLLGTRYDCLLEVFVRNSKLFALVLQLSNQFVYLVLGKTSFKFL